MSCQAGAYDSHPGITVVGTISSMSERISLLMSMMSVERYDLCALSAEQVKEILLSVFGKCAAITSVDSSVVEYVVQHSEDGNPRAVTNVVMQLADLLSQPDTPLVTDQSCVKFCEFSMDRCDVVAPSLIKWLTNYSTEEQMVVSVAACFEGKFCASMVSSVMPKSMSEACVSSILQLLVFDSVLEASSPEADRTLYWFASHSVKLDVYNCIPVRDKKLCHRSIAKLLQESVKYAISQQHVKCGDYSNNIFSYRNIFVSFESCHGKHILCPPTSFVHSLAYHWACWSSDNSDCSVQELRLALHFLSLSCCQKQSSTGGFLPATKHAALAVELIQPFLISPSADDLSQACLTQHELLSVAMMNLTCLLCVSDSVCPNAIQAAVSLVEQQLYQDMPQAAFVYWSLSMYYVLMCPDTCKAVQYAQMSVDCSESSDMYQKLHSHSIMAHALFRRDGFCFGVLQSARDAMALFIDSTFPHADPMTVRRYHGISGQFISLVIAMQTNYALGNISESRNVVSLCETMISGTRLMCCLQFVSACSCRW